MAQTQLCFVRAADGPYLLCALLRPAGHARRGPRHERHRYQRFIELIANPPPPSRPEGSCASRKLRDNVNSPSTASGPTSLRASGRSRPNPRLQSPVLFLPSPGGLKRLLLDAERSASPATLRGMVKGDMRGTSPMPSCAWLTKTSGAVSRLTPTHLAPTASTLYPPWWSPAMAA